VVDAAEQFFDQAVQRGAEDRLLIEGSPGTRATPPRFGYVLLVMPRRMNLDSVQLLYMVQILGR